MRRLVLGRGVCLPASSRLPSVPAGVRVMGIDPGTLKVGYAVLGREGVLDVGVIRARASDPIDRRLGRIHAGLGAVLSKWKPSSVALESAFYGKSVSAALRIGEGRGAALVAAASQGVPVASYPPATVKKAVSGSGNATKAEIRSMVQATLGTDLGKLPMDASDALAIALCHLYRTRV